MLDEGEPQAAIYRTRADDEIIDVIPQGCDVHAEFCRWCVIHGDYNLSQHTMSDWDTGLDITVQPVAILVSPLGSTYLWYKGHYEYMEHVQLYARVEPQAAELLRKLGFPIGPNGNGNGKNGNHK